MPIIQTNSGYGYVYKTSVKRKKKMPKFFKFILWTSVIFIMCVCGLYISRLIPNIAGINTNLLVASKQVYAVSGGQFEDYNTAFVFSETIKKQGAAGYVYKQEKVYYVLLGGYPKKEQALKVIENLSYDGIDTNLVTLSFFGLSINLSVDKAEKATIKTATNMFYTCYEKLYEYSLDYDKNLLSKGEVLNSIDQLKSQVNEAKRSLKTSSDNISQAGLVYLKLYLGDLQQCLDDLSNCKENFNAEIKNSYFKSLELYASLRQEIGK